MKNIYPYQWNQCNYKDCIEGMKLLPDKCISLCITDPPYNKESPGAAGYDRKRNITKVKDAEQYNNMIDHYEDFCDAFFTQARRICDDVIFACGSNNLGFWLNKNPDDILYHYKPNGVLGSKIAMFNHIEPYVYWGKKRRIFDYNVLRINAETGMLREIPELVHPHPKNHLVWRKIVEAFKPKSVIDPFLGSGTTAQVCEELGICWVGFEIKLEYKPDIDLRIKIGKSNAKRIAKKKSSLDDIFGASNDG
jgi:DNA modification methylase